jgi:hypothetical protein
MCVHVTTDHTRSDYFHQFPSEQDLIQREGSVHDAEELLSAVLMRKCPQKNCGTPIIKEETSKSCNKMTCTVCKKDMCYCCRKDVTGEGYRHFDMESDGVKSKRKDSKCPLWEDTLERHKKDVEKVRLKLGRAAPSKTTAEGLDEIHRRKQYNQHVEEAALDFGIAAIPGLVDDVVYDDDIVEVMQRLLVHQAVVNDRARQKQEAEEVLQRQAQKEEADRLYLNAERDSRLQALGFLPPQSPLARTAKPLHH